MIGNTALLVLACTLMLVAVASLIAYLVFSIKLWRLGPIGAAILFASGCIVWLIPVGMFYLYTPPWNMPLPNHAMRLNLDNCFLVGILLISGANIIELLSALARSHLRIKRIPNLEGYVFIAQVLSAWLLNLAISLENDPLLTDLPGYAAQRLGFWWFGLGGTMVFMFILALAARARYKGFTRSSAEATPQSTQRMDTSA